MISRTGVAFVLVVLVLTVLMAPAPAEATCRTNADCVLGDSCVVTLDLWILKFRDCRPTACNQDADCVGGTICLLGRCQNACRNDAGCAANAQCADFQCKTPEPRPSPGTIPGEGRKCIPPDGSKPTGWATDANGKPLGACPRGTACSNRGYCQRLEP